jgi:uncharacterized protein (TIGR02996 family)
MTDRDALYRAIIENPADDTLRLVYADALEEDGESRHAAFIRAHIELTRLPEYDPLAIHIQHHGQDARPDPHWVLEFELPEGIHWARAPFRRGLPGAIEADDGAAFVANSGELFARFPIESLDLRVVRMSEVRAVAECPWLGRIASLSFPQGTSAQVIRPIFESPHLTRLTELVLASQFTTSATVSAVARSPAFRRLTSLSVRSDSRAVGSMATLLAAQKNPPALKKLDLSSNRLTADVVSQLVASEAVEAVEYLDLSENNLRAAGVAALAEGRLPALRSLHLLRAQPQEGGVEALAAAGFFPELRSLSLGGNNLGPGAVFALAGAPADHLRVLDLRENRVGDRGAKSLAANPRLGNLLHLDLSGAQINNAGAEALAESPHLGGLSYLNLFDNSISPRAADRLRARFGDRVFL